MPAASIEEASESVEVESSAGSAELGETTGLEEADSALADELGPPKFQVFEEIGQIPADVAFEDYASDEPEYVVEHPEPEPTPLESQLRDEPLPEPELLAQIETVAVHDMRLPRAERAERSHREGSWSAESIESVDYEYARPVLLSSDPYATEAFSEDELPADEAHNDVPTPEMRSADSSDRAFGRRKNDNPRLESIDHPPQPEEVDETPEQPVTS